MGWLRLDDAFGDHPKVAGLSDRAFRAHVLGLLYCARQLTDGFVPQALAPSARVTGELERAGLWSPNKRGWVIHDFLDYNPSKAETLDKRAAKSMAGAKGAAVRWQGSAMPSASRSHRRRNAPDPTPTPTPNPSAPSRRRDELFEALAEVSGADLGSLTRSARGQLNDATKQLREIGATPNDVRARAQTYRRVHPTWDFTVSALVKHWPNLNGRPLVDRGSGGRPIEDLTDEELEELTRRG